MSTPETHPATIRVKFPKSQWPGWSQPEFIDLTSVSDSGHDSGPKNTLISVNPDHSDYSSDSPVFRASIEDAEFVLKFAMREDLIYGLRSEFSVYHDVLKTLQGRDIPRCFGLYAGEGEDGEPIACLLLEYWGECLKQPFHLLALDLRIQILQRLGAIHREGLLHGDFAERNVLLHHGDQVRIIDFDASNLGHDCHCKMNFRPGEKLPSIEEFGCDQLWEVCRSELRIWDTTTDV